MPTPNALRNEARKRLDKFENEQLVPHGWNGDVTDYGEIIDFMAEKGLTLEPAQRAGLRKATDAVKAFDVAVSDDGKSATLTYFDDMGEAELEEEDKPADGLAKEDAKRLNSSVAKQLDEMRQTIKSLRLKAGETPKVTTKLPGEAQWEAKKRLGQTRFHSAEDAHKFGLLIASGLPGVFGEERSGNASKAISSRYGTKAQATSPLSAGGATVADNLMSEVLATFDEYGVARRYLRNLPMPKGTAELIEDRNGITAGYPGEGNPITESQLDMALNHLRAKKLAMLCKLSSEVIQDSIISIGEYVAGRFVDTAQQKEDEALFLGDGTGAYGSINGLAGTFTAKASNYRNVTGATGSESHTKNHLQAMMAKLPARYRKGAAWHCHSAMTSYIFDNLASNVGGVQMQEVMGFGWIKTYANIPIVENFVMNSDPNASSDVVDVYLGNLGEAGIFADTRSLDIKTSDVPLMANDQTLIVGTRRYDINLWNLGDTNSQSPVVALWQD